MTSPSEPRTRSLYHAAPKVSAAVVIVVLAVFAIYATQSACMALRLPSLVALAASFLVVTAGLCVLARRDLAIIGLVRPRPRFVVAAVLVGMTTWYVDFWLEQAVNPPGDTSALEHVIERASLAPALVVLAIVPAIAEELLFRGVLARALARRLPVLAAVAISAVVFSAYHLLPAQMVGTFPLALMLGLLAIRSDSVWPGVLAHALNNEIVVLVAHANSGVVTWVFSHPTGSLVAAFAALAAAIALTGVSRPTSST
jgi:membrane protease YdiL (CAAX protease family)